MKSTRHGCEGSLIGHCREFFSLATKPRPHTPPTPKHLPTPSPNPPDTRYTLDSHPRPAPGLHFFWSGQMRHMPYGIGYKRIRLVRPRCWSHIFRQSDCVGNILHQNITHALMLKSMVYSWHINQVRISMAVRVQLRSDCGDGNVWPMLDSGGISMMGGSVFEAPGCVRV